MGFKLYFSLFAGSAKFFSIWTQSHDPNPIHPRKEETSVRGVCALERRPIAYLSLMLGHLGSKSRAARALKMAY